MPPKQLQLHGFFKSTGRSTPDTGNADIRAAAKEVVLEKLATTSNLDFVKNGSRDKTSCRGLQQVIPCWIGPGMTPVVQVTDTDVAFPLKRIIERKKVEISLEFKEIALLAGRDTSFKMGPPELMKVLCGAVEEFKETADAQQLVLHALRRNGQLAYITLNGKFEKLSEELCPWMSKLCIGDLGSHRYPRAWLEDRFSWTVDGVPVKPDWSDCLRKVSKKLARRRSSPRRCRRRSPRLRRMSRSPRKFGRQRRTQSTKSSS
jgi:hypothetical protein